MVFNLLQIVQTSQRELGLPQASSVIGNPDITTQQMLGFANATLDELRQVKDDGWTELQFEYNLVVSPPVTTTGDTVIDSPVVSNIPSTAGLSANDYYASGNNIPQGARILSVDSPTQVTLTMEATGTEIGAAFVFARDTYPLPEDFDFYINRTFWDRTNRWELLGPDSPQLDQWHRSGIVATGPRRHFRQVGPYASRYRLWPPPTEIVNPLQIVFEYTSIASVRVEGSTTNFSQYFTADTDIPLLNDRAIILGVKWRFWEQKGFNWVVKRSEYDEYVSRLMARDGAAGTLSLVQRVNPIFISPANVQDGFFPGPTGPNMG